MQQSFGFSSDTKDWRQNSKNYMKNAYKKKKRAKLLRWVFVALFVVVFFGCVEDEGFGFVCGLCWVGGVL